MWYSGDNKIETSFSLEKSIEQSYWKCNNDEIWFGEDHNPSMKIQTATSSWYKMRKNCKSNRKWMKKRLTGGTGCRGWVWRRSGRNRCSSSVIKQSQYEFCENCIYDKQAKSSFPWNKRAHSHRVLELIHTNAYGPMNQLTWDGFRYFVAFTDDFSRASMIYCIERKDQILEKIQEIFGDGRSTTQMQS